MDTCCSLWHLPLPFLYIHSTWKALDTLWELEKERRKETQERKLCGWKRVRVRRGRPPPSPPLSHLVNPFPLLQLVVFLSLISSLNLKTLISFLHFYTAEPIRSGHFLASCLVNHLAGLRLVPFSIIFPQSFIYYTSFF